MRKSINIIPFLTIAVLFTGCASEPMMKNSTNKTKPTITKTSEPAISQTTEKPSEKPSDSSDTTNNNDEPKKVNPERPKTTTKKDDNELLEIKDNDTFNDRPTPVNRKDAAMAAIKILDLSKDEVNFLDIKLGKDEPVWTIVFETIESNTSYEVKIDGLNGQVINNDDDRSNDE